MLRNQRTCIQSRIRDLTEPCLLNRVPFPCEMPEDEPHGEVRRVLTPDKGKVSNTLKNFNCDTVSTKAEFCQHLPKNQNDIGIKVPKIIRLQQPRTKLVTLSDQSPEDGRVEVDSARDTSKMIAITWSGQRKRTQQATGRELTGIEGSSTSGMVVRTSGDGLSSSAYFGCGSALNLRA